MCKDMAAENNADGPSSVFSRTGRADAIEGLQDAGDSRNIKLRRDDV